MKFGRVNIYLGLMTLIAASIGGFALGKSLDPYYAHGYGQIPLWRYLIKAGHTHGMPFGLINIIFGMLISSLNCSSGIRRAASILTATALLLPVGVCLRGFTEGAKFCEILAMLGGFSLIVACILLIVGVSSSNRKESDAGR
jgi:hypothetical protein